MVLVVNSLHRLRRALNLKTIIFKSHVNATFTEQQLKRDAEEGLEIPEGWKDKFSKEENKGGVMGLSEFAVLFPKYRESYIKQSWPLVQAALSKTVCTIYLYYMPSFI